MVKSKILIVDDDDDVRDSLFDELCGNYDVEAVASGEAAMELFASRNYDAVISDLRMPGKSGIEVLEAARDASPEVIRILLTGYLDSDAHRATLQPDAPFKVGKPWHDELEVTLRRAFEFRDAKRALTSSVGDALAVAGVDDELSATEGLSSLALVVHQRASHLGGVESCGVVLDVCGRRRMLAGQAPSGPDPLPESGRWRVEEPIVADGDAFLIADVTSDSTRDILEFLARRARHWSSQDEATKLARQAASDPQARSRLSDVARRATLGGMTAALVHELASIVQALQAALFDLDSFVRDTADRDPEVLDSLATVTEMSKRMVSLFTAMRSFVRNGETNHRSCRVGELIERGITLVQAYARARVELRVEPIADIEVMVSEPLMLQVVINLLRNAVDASPTDGVVTVRAEVDADWVRIAVSDEGMGVAAEVVPRLFEPFVTTKDQHEGSGLGLAIAAHIVAEHGGRIDYEPLAVGSRFTLTLPSVKALQASAPLLEP